jgi:hypothetical protein
MAKKVGAKKTYNCDIKTLTVSIPVNMIEALKEFIKTEKKKHMVNQ